MTPSPRKIPRIGSLTASVSLALVVHGALLLLIIGFTIERVARPTSLTDAPDSLNSVLLQDLSPGKPLSGPAVAAAKPHTPEPAGSPDGTKVAVAIPTTEAVAAPKANDFQSKVADEIPSTPQPRPLGNPAPPKLLPTAPSTPSLAHAGTGGDGDARPPTSDGAGSGVAAFTNVKGDSAKRIVYVIDGSGSMAICLPFIRAELLHSIARLDNSQSFQIVVFRDPPPGSQAAGTFILNPRKTSQSTMLTASDLNKSILREWLESVQPLGRSTPLAGIEIALELQPDLIFILSRGIKRSGVGDIESVNQATLDRLDALNPINPLTRKRRTVIKSLQFIDDDPSGLMQSIARTHGDASESYKVIPVPERYRNSGQGGQSRTKEAVAALEKN